MLRAVIVDDEIMVRATLEKQVDWQAQGVWLEGCCANGLAALELLKRQPADILITDMRMPQCDGLELIDRVHELGQEPYIIVLSAFDEFELVKQAFKKGAADYVLKQEIGEDRMIGLLREAKAALEKRPAPAEIAEQLAAPDTSTIFRDVFYHNAAPQALPGMSKGYGIACFFLDEVDREMERLGGDVTGMLTTPLTQLVMQMPQIRPCDGFYSMDASRQFLFYSLDQPDRTQQKARSFFARVQRAWKNYMNISCTVGVAFPKKEPQREFYKVLKQAEMNTTLRYVYGPGRIYDGSEKGFDLTKAQDAGNEYKAFIRAVMNADTQQAENYKNELVGRILESSVEEGQALVMEHLYNLYFEMCFYDMQVAYKLGLEHQLYEKVYSIGNSRDLVIYFSSVVRRIMEYFESNYDKMFPDSMLKAKRYMDDNYMRTDLSLGETAKISGYNEKYFCTLFKRRFDCSFSDYLTHQRIAAARELLEKTDLRSYEICDAVGYNNVEHFMRTFKRETGMTPMQFRKKNVKIHQ